MKLGYIGLDQYGNHYKIDKYPRKELLEHFGVKHADKMYCDPDARHIGYVISGHWIRVHEVHDWGERSS